MELIKIFKITDKKMILQDFNPDNSLWITSDIKSQLFILNQIQKNKFINSTCIMRATDFWSYLLSIVHPEKHIISRAFLTLIYHEWAKFRKQKWEKNRETGAILCQYMEALAHLLQHPLKDNLIEEWKTSKTNKKDLYWTKWYGLTSDFWHYLDQKKIIESSWAGTFLLEKIPFEHIEFKEIIFDLGFEIDRVEAELIRQISTKIKTKVLVPLCRNDNHQNYVSSIYKLLNQKKTSLAGKETYTTPLGIKIKKFVTPLAEVKDISSQITTALHKGIKPDKISVLAPHIEDYWTCLKSYFNREKIPVNKRETVSLCSFPVTQLWLAKMWTHLCVIKYENLETIYTYQNQYINFSQLKSDFYNIKKIEDWPAGVYIKDQLKNKDELITSAEFTKWASELLPPIEKNRTAYQYIKECLNDFLQSTKYIKDLQLQWQSWLNLLEFFLKNKEIEIYEGDPNGINCLSFNAIGWMESDFIYIAGLSEQNMKTDRHNVISSLEACSILENLGFFIKNKPVDKLEQIISYFIHQGHKELVLSFAATDFLGTPLNPSCLWLKKAMEYKKNINHFNTPGITVWDQQQRKPVVKDILSHCNIKNTQSELVEQSIKEDLGYKELMPFFQKGIKNLSASSLDDYIKCPFIFAAKKLFHLWDGPERDMDIPAIEHGSIVHKLFEILKKMKQKTNPTEQDILQIIEDIKESKKFKKQMQKIHPVIWEKEKSYLLKKALIFLEQEKRKNTLFGDYQTIACETKYHCYWNFETQSLTTKGDISFRGKIDRIDSNNQFYQIIDYKSSLPTGSSAPYWETQENFQMAFYIQALEFGLTDLPPLSVKSALYLNYKNFNSQGLAIKEPAYIQLLGSPKKRSLISEEKKKSILQNVNRKTNTFILNIHKGKFQTQPKTKNLCIKCRWRNICRASHLT